jgi:hypothetical protein
MDYIIRNHKGVHIRLNSNGAPVTCAEHEKTLFEYSKAIITCNDDLFI